MIENNSVLILQYHLEIKLLQTCSMQMHFLHTENSRTCVVGFEKGQFDTDRQFKIYSETKKMLIGFLPSFSSKYVASARIPVHSLLFSLIICPLFRGH